MKLNKLIVFTIVFLSVFSYRVSYAGEWPRMNNPNLIRAETKMSIGATHTLFIKDGRVYASGSNYWGQLGSPEVNPWWGTTSVPKIVKRQDENANLIDFTDVIAVAAGLDFSLALTADGQVWAWGNNNNGQLGNGMMGGSTYFYPTKVLVDEEIYANPFKTPNINPTLTNLNRVIAIDVGYRTAVALRDDGSVFTWGDAYGGALGRPYSNNAAAYARIVTYGFSCDGGSNEYGNMDSYSTAIVAISFAGHHGLALNADGTVFTWGQNYMGALGDNTTVAERNWATKVADINGIIGCLSHVIAVECGLWHGMALLSTGKVVAWGYNDKGALAQADNGALQNSYYPRYMKKGLNDDMIHVVAISSGEQASMVLQATGNVFVCGSNTGYGLGLGSAVTQKDVLTQVSNLALNTNVQSIAMGFAYDLVWNTFNNNTVFVLLGNGQLYGWGNNQYGQLGNNNSNNTSSPTNLIATVYQPTDKIKSMSGGYNHASAVTNKGNLVLWGNSDYGQLGKLTAIDCSMDPPLSRWVTVPSIYSNDPLNGGDDNSSFVLGVACGISTTHILRTNGQVYSMGTQKYGNLGNNVAFNDGDHNYCNNVLSGLYLSSTAYIVGIDAGIECVVNQKNGSFALAVTSEGKVLAWGNDGYHQTGQLTVADGGKRKVPIYVTKTNNQQLDDIVQVACSAKMGFALDSKGQVWCWGFMNNRPNNPQFTAMILPTQPLQKWCVKAISANGSYLLMLAPDGKVWSWGYNQFGECGVNNTSPDIVYQVLQSAEEELQNVRYIAAGSQAGMAIKSDGNLYTWGSNVSGELGRNINPPGNTKYYIAQKAKFKTELNDVFDITNATVAGGGCQFSMMQSTSLGFLTAGKTSDYVQGNGNNSGAPRTSFMKPIGALSIINRNDVNASAKTNNSNNDFTTHGFHEIETLKHNIVLHEGVDLEEVLKNQIPTYTVNNDFTVNVYDILGKNIMSKIFSQKGGESFTTNQIPIGNYFLEVLSNNTLVYRTMLIIK